jgi:AcrR family transcriptional regulator
VIATKSATGVELSRATIVEKALEIIDREGPDAVTIRRIAQEFGVTPMALYWHVPNKEELLNAVGDSFFTGMKPPERVGSWCGGPRPAPRPLRP